MFLSAQASPLILILPLILSELLSVSAQASLRKESYPHFECIQKSISPSWILLIAFIVTTIRSFVGYAIPISWNKELWQGFFLFFIMGTGKALGGIMVNAILIVVLSLVSYGLLRISLDDAKH